MYSGNVVTFEGGTMHKPKVSALSVQDRYYIARVHYNQLHNAQKLVYELFSVTYPKWPLVLKFIKCALHNLKYSQVIDSEESDSLRVT